MELATSPPGMDLPAFEDEVNDQDELEEEEVRYSYSHHLG